MFYSYHMKDLEFMDKDSWFEYGDSINSYIDLGLLINKMSKPIMPAVQESTQDVPGMYGNVFMGNDYGEMTFTIPVTLLAFDETSYNIICENLRHVFTADSEDPGKETPIVFSDRPGIRYYGHWGAMSDPQFITPNGWQAKATLTFICSQPYGYMDQTEMSVYYPDQPIVPLGNAKTYPIYRIHLKEDVYNVGFLSSTGKKGYVATGYQVDDDNTDDEGNRIKDNTPVDTYEDPTRMDDWITDQSEVKQILTFTPDDKIDGQLGERDGQNGIMPAPITRVDKNRDPGEQNVQTLNYGNQDVHPFHEYYGPMAIHPQFNNPTENWRFMINLWSKKNSTDQLSRRAIAATEVYLLDENGQRRGRIEIHLPWADQLPTVHFYLGDKENEKDMLSDSTSTQGNSDSPWGPQKIGNYNFIRKRKYSEKGVPITSLFQYKQLVVAKKKAKQRIQRKKANNNRRTNASRKAQRRASMRKWGNGRHVKHYGYHRKKK